jgi:predicted nucleic acid-binding protein
MKIVVDTNIVFSAILNTQSKIGQLLINGSKYFDFYTVCLLHDEIIAHKDKILNSTKYSQDQFSGIFEIIASRIVFVDDILLNDNDLKDAAELVSDVDPDDALFVALTNHLVADLWTGDKRLLIGLKKKGFSRILTTDEIYEIFLDKQLDNR